jgi:hypothetical protein
MTGAFAAGGFVATLTAASSMSAIFLARHQLRRKTVFGA